MAVVSVILFCSHSSRIEDIVTLVFSSTHTYFHNDKLDLPHNQDTCNRHPQEAQQTLQYRRKGLIIPDLRKCYLPNWHLFPWKPWGQRHRKPSTPYPVWQVEWLVQGLLSQKFWNGNSFIVLLHKVNLVPRSLPFEIGRGREYPWEQGCHIR